MQVEGDADEILQKLLWSGRVWDWYIFVSAGMNTNNAHVNKDRCSMGKLLCKFLYVNVEMMTISVVFV